MKKERKIAAPEGCEIEKTQAAVQHQGRRREMTSKEKAQEIIQKYKKYVFSPKNYGLEQCLLEMAKWKEMQMIDKAYKFLSKRVFSYDDNFIKDFKKAMKGGEE